VIAGHPAVLAAKRAYEAMQAGTGNGPQRQTKALAAIKERLEVIRRQRAK
jgi:hypothetical protein